MGYSVVFVLLGIAVDRHTEMLHHGSISCLIRFSSGVMAVLSVPDLKIMGHRTRTTSTGSRSHEYEPRGMLVLVSVSSFGLGLGLALSHCVCAER
jgi:hypothetical protein